MDLQARRTRQTARSKNESADGGQNAGHAAGYGAQKVQHQACDHAKARDAAGEVGRCAKGMGKHGQFAEREGGGDSKGCRADVVGKCEQLQRGEERRKGGGGKGVAPM